MAAAKLIAKAPGLPRELLFEQLPEGVRNVIPVLDSGRPDGRPTDEAPLAPGATVTVPGHTVLLLTAD